MYKRVIVFVLSASSLVACGGTSRSTSDLSCVGTFGNACGDPYDLATPTDAAAPDLSVASSHDLATGPHDLATPPAADLSCAPVSGAKRIFVTSMGTTGDLKTAETPRAGSPAGTRSARTRPTR